MRNVRKNTYSLRRRGLPVPHLRERSSCNRKVASWVYRSRVKAGVRIAKLVYQHGSESSGLSTMPVCQTHEWNVGVGLGVCGCTRKGWPSWMMVYTRVELMRCLHEASFSWACRLRVNLKKYLTWPINHRRWLRSTHSQPVAGRIELLDS